MSKITFRADDDLVEELEALEVSKSEAMREALRAYLDGGAAARQEHPSESERGRDAVTDSQNVGSGETAIDDIVRKHVDDLLTERLGELERERERKRKRERGPRGRTHAGEAQDVNVTISLEGRATGRVDEVEGRPQTQTRAQSRGAAAQEGTDDRPSRRQDHDHELDREDHRTCNQCGEDVDDGHVYCPNCGEKVSQRLFCECGDELRSDWGFCPGCGRRTPTADVLESNSR